MGLPCMPTRSLLETRREGNVGSFMELRDPFGSGERVGLSNPFSGSLSYPCLGCDGPAI